MKEIEKGPIEHKDIIKNNGQKGVFKLQYE